MNPSFYINFIASFLALAIGKLTEKFNGEKERQKYMHKEMLDEDYSADLHWGSTTLEHSIVAADVVSTNSPLPLKSRDKIANATGKIPKLGIKFKKDEEDILQYNTMLRSGTDVAMVAAKILSDAPRCAEGMDVRKEILFQQALSTGYAATDNEGNVGTSIRVNFGYKEENKVVALVDWTQASATPISDLREIFDLADEHGDAINEMYISKKYFNLARKSQEGKELYANFNDQIVLDPTTLRTPSEAKFLDALSDEFGATFHIVKSSFVVEQTDGEKKVVRPWVECNVIGTPSPKVGRLVYTQLAEETNPVQGVLYEKMGTHTLISKYSKNDPLEEFTTAQAMCLPVLDGADAFYLLQAKPD